MSALPGIGLAVDVLGAGPPLLLLHGFTGTAATWSAVVAACRDHRRVMTPDLVGHGRSPTPADPAAYDLERQADALAVLVRGLDASPADVVGYSMGARLGLQVALDHPETVRSLVLESPSAGVGDPAARAIRREADEGWARLVETEGIDAFADAWEAQPLFASHAALPDDERERVHRERRGQDQLAIAASLRGAGQGAMTPAHDRLGQLAVPTLVIAGELDPVGVGRAREMAELISGAHLELVPNAGHTPHLEQPQAFIGLLCPFLGLPSALPAR